MQQHPEWRIEKYMDEMDPFATIQWYVMQGNIVIAQCEQESHAEVILAHHDRHVAYEAILYHISSMTSDTHNLDAAIEAARDALTRGDAPR